MKVSTSQCGINGCLLWFGLLLIASVSMAQPGKEMRFERLSIEQGLSQPTVSCLLQDTHGYLWLGTQNGLNRYDGYGVEVFFQESGKLSHDWITSLAEDSSGDFWIGSEGGIARWGRNSGEISVFRHDPASTSSLSSDRVRLLLFDRDGIFWVGTDDSGLNRLDPSTGQISRFRHDSSAPDSLGNDHLRAVLEDREGRLWIGTLAGLSRFDRETSSFARVPLSPDGDPDRPPLEVRALFQDRKGDLWIGTQLGLIRFQPDTGDKETFRHSPDPGSLNHDLIRVVFEDSEGRLWVGTAGGLNLRREPGGPFVGFDSDTSNPDSIGSDQVSTILEDRSGNLWFGTLTGGAFKWNPRTLSFQHLREGQGNDDDQRNLVFAISEDADHHLWTGSLGGGLTEQNRQSSERTHYVHDSEDRSSLSEDRVTALLHDAQERLWVGTMTKGLNLLEPEGRRFRHYRHDPDVPDSISSDSITTLSEDESSQLWIGTFGGGINRFLGHGRFERYTSSDSGRLALSSDRIFALAPDKHSRIWIATDGGGLNLLDPEKNRVYHWRHEDTVASSLNSDELYSLHIDDAGHLWIGSKNHGLDLLESLDLSQSAATFRHYNLTDGATSNTIWGIESDTRGRIWLSTSSGLVRLEPESGSVRRYDTSHGLQSNEFNLGAHFRSADGELFFGGVNGVNAFFPEQVRDNTTPPPVVLTGFHMLNQPVDVGRPLTAVQEFELAHDDHFLAFEFAALDFTAPEQNRYRYQLEGFEDRWVDLGTNRRVSFTSLNPGHYVLRVQGSNSDGVWSGEGSAIQIQVKPPVWATWWAYTFYGLLAVALAIGFLRRRERKILDEKKRLEDLVAARTRELKARATELEVANHKLAEENLCRRQLESEREELLEQIEAIGRYRMEAKLGAGGMGEVYRAFDLYLNRPVAMKFIHPNYLGTEIARERFRREARLVASVQHEAVVQVYDVLRWSDRECIVMELIDGWTLSSILEEGPLEPSWTVRRLIEITSGLAAAHAKEVVHRDLKAGNVMVTRSGKAKILDFGLAKRLTKTEITLSRSGQILGTLSSMSPEQAMGEPVGLRADLFSLGALAYLMLTGKEPFLGDNPLHTLKLITAHQPEPVRSVEAGVPQPLSDLIGRLLEKSPAERPRDALEVLAALGEIDPQGLQENSMARIREMFRLKWVKGLGVKEVSAEVCTPESVVTRLGSRAHAAGIRGWSELESLDEMTLADLLTNPLRDPSR